MTMEAGARLGHYRIIELLGRGGMADVYRAEDERLGREVALKAVPPEFARDSDRVERFKREVRAAARLNHPNIVTVFEFGQGEGLHFYTMALMQGGDLKTGIRAHPEGMPPAETRTVAVAVTRALHYAHRRGFVHRDVKPENILFGEEGTPQLTDFGIARAMGSGTRMTATGMSIGSPRYMSPEQARGRDVDGRSDLYSLGVVLYEMLTGRLPFDAADTFAVAYSHINDPVPELSRELAAWQPVVERLLAKSPEDRYGSGGELVEVLESATMPVSASTRVLPVRQDVVRPVPEERSGARVETGAMPVLGGGGLLVVETTPAGAEVLVDGHPVGNTPLERRDIRAGVREVTLNHPNYETVHLADRKFEDGVALRLVHVLKPRVGRLTVTQWQWEAVMGSNPSHFDQGSRDRPVENVSWNEVQAFVKELNRREVKAKYRLPTEAEWEYAARAGTDTDTYAGNVTEPRGNDPVLNRIAWYEENSEGQPQPVGKKEPNRFGLHDMLGNVWEWVEDWYGKYSGGAVTDPAGAGSGSTRVARGGSWGNFSWHCRSSICRSVAPGTRIRYLGFRLLRTE